MLGPVFSCDYCKSGFVALLFLLMQRLGLCQMGEAHGMILFEKWIAHPSFDTTSHAGTIWSRRWCIH